MDNNVIASETAWKQAAEIVGAENVLSGPAPGTSGIIAYPSSAAEVCDLVRLAAGNGWKIAPCGNGSKQRLAGAANLNIDLVISLRRMSRLLEHEPADLTVTAEAGMPVKELAASLRDKGQMLPLDIPFRDEASIGGALASNSSGSLRLGYGTWRDFVIGTHYVTADGKLAKSGGKVVKNVAGYDIIKILIGSFGTLGIITDVTFRVFPIPPANITFLFGFSTPEHALQTSAAILNSPIQPQAMDLLNHHAAAQCGIAQPGAFYLAVAAAGHEEVIRRVRYELPQIVHPERPSAVLDLHGDEEHAVWERIQEFTPEVIKRHASAAVIKSSVILSKIGELIRWAETIADENVLACATVARAGSGIVYAYFWTETSDDEQSLKKISSACTQLLRRVSELGGQATIECVPPGLQGKIEQWEPLPDSFSAMQRLKRGLDPEGLLNPGRLYGKI